MDLSILKKSRWLLLTLFALMATVPVTAQKALPYEYGFEDYNLDSDGWTKYFGTTLSSNNNECVIAGTAKKTGDYGFRFSSYKTKGENAQYLISPELDAPNGVIVSFSWKVSHGQYQESFKVGYSTTDTDESNFTWVEDKTSNSTSWSTYEYTFPAGTKYVAIYYYSNYCAYLYVDDFSFTAPVSGPALVVTDGTTAMNSGYNYNFGLATAGTTHTFMLSNPGTEDLAVSIAKTGDFGAALSAYTVPAGGTSNVLLTVTMPEATGSSEVTITPASGSGIDTFIINVSGTIRDASKVYEYGFTALPTDWATTGTWNYSSLNGAYTTAWYLTSNARLITPKLDITEGETFFVEAKGYSTTNTSYQHLQMQYSADGTTWTNFDSEPTLNPSNWETFSFTGVPAGQYYIAINGSQVDIRMFYGGSLPVVPKMVVTQPTSLDYGVIAEATAKTFTIANTGLATLSGISVSSSNSLFTITGAPTSLEAGATAEVTITMAATTTGNLSSDITVSATDMENVLFTVTGIVLPDGLSIEDFGSGLPSGWANASWTFADGTATGKSSSAYLTTPKLKFADGDIIVIKAKRYDNDASDYLTVQGSSDDGATWTAYSKKLQNAQGLTYPDYGTIVLSDIPTTINKLRFVGYYVVVDEIRGLTYDDNAPQMGIYSDVACTTAVTTTEKADFGFASADATVNYYIKNDGTGTMELTLGATPAGFTQTLDKTAVTAGDHATLTVTLPTESRGYHEGTVVVTATDLGDFTLTVSGVQVEEGKLNIDFATDNIPASWTANNWSKNASGYAETSGYSSTTMETSTLTSTAGEEIVVVAKQTQSSSYYTFGVNYRVVGTTTWNTLIAAANIGTSWRTLHASIAEAGDYELQFVGSYAQIQRIYGLTEPNEALMIIYDGDDIAANTYDFGNVPNDADAVKVFTVMNAGKAPLTGLSAQLSGSNADHYTVSVEGTVNDEVAAGATATITVTQLKDNLGAHAATLTITATDQEDKVIALSGVTRDASKLYVDFEDNTWPAGWTKNSWTITTTSGNLHARAGFTASALVTAPLTVEAGDVLSFKAKRQYTNTAPDFRIRYTTDGGINWTEYIDYASQVTSGDFTNIELTGIPAGTVVVEFYGRYVDLDEIFGFGITAAPMIAVTESSTAVAPGSTKEFGNLTAAGSATYMVKNTGNGTLVATVHASGVNASADNFQLPAGESIELTVTLPYEAPYGAKTGTLTIESEGWVDDFTINFTATTIDPTAVYIDFADNAKPAGFYSNGWSFSSSYAANTSSTEAEFITSKLTVSGSSDVLTYDARAYYSNWGEKLTVSYSTDRKNWNEVTTLGTDELTTTFQSFQIAGLDAGDYYLKFAGTRVYFDNINGWHYATPIPEHDLYVASATLPTDAVIPENSYMATVNVASLRTAETVTAELYFDGTKVAELTEQDIALNATKNFELTGNVPATEGNYDVYVKVYNADVTVETEHVSIDVAHTRILNVTAFVLTSSADVTADDNNQFDATFEVTVQNSGTTTVNVAAMVKDEDGNFVGSADAADPLDIGESTTLTVNAEHISAGEGGTLNFFASAWINTNEFTYATPVSINVEAAAPKFALYQDATPVNDGNNVDFGIANEDKTFSYVIKNEGSADLELLSITVPGGFTTTTLTDANKTIAPNAELEFDVTMKADQGGALNGQLVITYKVDATTNKTFTLDLSGVSLAEGTWICLFNDSEAPIPDGWVNDKNQWQIASSTSDYAGAVYNYNAGGSWLMTPRLAGEDTEELTYHVDFLGSGNSLKVEYSTNLKDWTEYETITTAGDHSFTAPDDGNYYLRFTGRYAYLSNFIGFKLYPLTELTLSENVTYDNGTEDDCSVTLSRPFIAGWNTLVLPFDVTGDDLLKFGDGAIFYAFSENENGELHFTKVSTLTAGTPYLINLPAAISADLVFDYVDVKTDVNDVADNGAEFKGNYEKGFSMAGKYGVTPAGKVQKGGASSTMKPFRAYIVFDDPSVAPRIAVYDETTGISRILSQQEVEDAEIFNLGGQRVGGNANGVLIINGKKVLVK